MCALVVVTLAFVAVNVGASNLLNTTSEAAVPLAAVELSLNVCEVIRVLTPFVDGAPVVLPKTVSGAVFVGLVAVLLLPTDKPTPI